MSQLEVNGLECVRNDRVLFSDLNFQVNEGQLLQIDGSNGSGKTSLLRILCGLSLPENGDVLWNGEPIQSIRQEFNQNVCYVGHTNGVKHDLTVLENLHMNTALNVQREDVQSPKVLSRMGLTGLQDVQTRYLSAGQRRRLALSRLLTNRARLWILDEPFTSLDVAGKKLIESIIEELVQMGEMIVYTTHQAVEFTNTPVNSIHLNK